MNCTKRDLNLSSPQQSYLSEIKEDALLSASEEKELAEAIARGDRDAKNRMIRANLRLVVKIAREYSGRGLMLDDLIGEGNLGLIRAAEEYDPRFGTRFSTYASYWIKQAIRHALINTTATIRLPAHMIGLMTKWRRMERALTRQLGFTPSTDEIAARLGLTETQKGLIAKAHRASHLKLENSFADEGSHWSASKSDELQEAPGTAIEAEEDRYELRRRLATLDDRERSILNYRFGLDGQPPLTLKEVGKRLGVTREWVRKIEIRALLKLNDDSAGRAELDKPRARRSSAGRKSLVSRREVDSKGLAGNAPSRESVAVASVAETDVRDRFRKSARIVNRIGRTAMTVSS
jgi:RNA polymerase primary sigma factor